MIRFLQPEPYPIYSHPFTMPLVFLDGVRLIILDKLRGK